MDPYEDATRQSRVKAQAALAMEFECALCKRCQSHHTLALPVTQIIDKRDPYPTAGHRWSWKLSSTSWSLPLKRRSSRVKPPPSRLKT